MKTTMISILATALATVCSAAPTAAAAQSLPAKFSLTFTPREGTALNTFKPEVVVERNYGQSLYVGPTYEIDFVETANFVSNGDGVILPHNDSGFKFNGALTVIASSGWVDIFPLFQADAERTATGFGQIGGKLTWDNGSGPQSLWNACTANSKNWELYFNPSASVMKSNKCLKIDLTVVPS